jgi:hypothetical protein
MASDDLFGTDSDSGNDTDDLIASAKKQPSSKATGTNKGDGSQQQKKRLGAAKKIATERLEKTNKAAAKKKNDIPGKGLFMFIFQFGRNKTFGYHIIALFFLAQFPFICK